LVIHCAAIAKFGDAEKDPLGTIYTNIQGTCNALRHAMTQNARFVFISSSHVFDGQKGNYEHTDLPNPLTRYAKSKVAGEMATLIYEKSLVIRTEFCDVDFPFDTAFTDKYSSKEYIDIIAPKIAEKCLSEQTGICHVGGPRRSFYEFGQLRNPNVKPGSVENFAKTSIVPILIDTSLIEN
jgi:dTDP-4-dehydrorhamnose reductase